MKPKNPPAGHLSGYLTPARFIKTKPIVTLGLLVLCATHLMAAEPQGRILKYGIYKRAEKEEIIKTPETPSGVTRLPVGYPSLAIITNRIPARMGVQFGVRYEVTNLDLKDGEVVELVKVMTHPPMKKPDGKVSQGFSFVEKSQVSGGRVEAQTGYGFDHDYELVPGVWQIEMQFKGKTLMTQEFTVFKER